MLPKFWIIPGSIYTHFFDRKKYRELISLGLLTQRGDVDLRKLGMIQLALEHPFKDAYRKNVYFQRCNEERNAAQGGAEDYFGTYDGGDMMDLWGGQDGSKTAQILPAVMATTLAAVSEEPFPFNSPMIFAMDNGTPIPNNYLPTSPQLLANVLSATSISSEAPSSCKNGSHPPIGDDIAMGTAVNDVLASFDL
ncbi:hypothetical protein C0992_005716 [Termitomyces sp. T32_za158]|nr:hypothetical protein C0992_005716 [Termitomyces sp. T32_za158]